MMPRLTKEQVEGLIAKETYLRHGTLTICVLDLKNGGTITGESNCIDPAAYDPDVGASVAREDAVDQIWALEGYALKTRGERA